MARGIIGKMIRGAAQTGVPMLVEQAKNEQLEKREIRLENLRSQNQQAATSQAQGFAAGENALDRKARAGEFAATQANSDRQFGLQEKQFGLQQEQFDAEKQQNVLKLEELNLSLADKKRASQFMDIIYNPESTPEDRSRAASILNAASGKGTPGFEFKTIDQFDDTGMRTGQKAINWDPLTGTGSEVKMVGGGAPSNIPQGAIDALLSEPTPERIAAFNQKYGQGLASEYLPDSSSIDGQASSTEPAAAAQPSSPVAQSQSPIIAGTMQNQATQEPEPSRARKGGEPLHGYDVVPSFSQKVGAYIDRNAAPELSTAESGVKQKLAESDAKWLQGYLDKGQLPGTGPLNSAKIKRALESGLLDLSEEEIGQLYGYINQ